MCICLAVQVEICPLSATRDGLLSRSHNRMWEAPVLSTPLIHPLPGCPTCLQCWVQPSALLRRSHPVVGPPERSSPYDLSTERARAGG
eukprot:scaffold5105_cov327-Prasinococcus_capsulatus_cf.AAC.2